MAGAQRVYKQKIKATTTLEKVFRAMELIAASRIAKARDTAMGADPYTKALTEAIAAVAAHSHVDSQPLLRYGMKHRHFHFHDIFHCRAHRAP